jgi:hypothetical protein
MPAVIRSRIFCSLTYNVYQRSLHLVGYVRLEDVCFSIARRFDGGSARLVFSGFRSWSLGRVCGLYLRLDLRRKHEQAERDDAATGGSTHSLRERTLLNY